MIHKIMLSIILFAIAICFSKCSSNMLNLPEHKDTSSDTTPVSDICNTDDMPLSNADKTVDINEALSFRFVWNNDMFYLIYGNNGEITLPDTTSEMYVLLIDGCFVPVLAIKENESVLVPQKAFDVLGIATSNDSEFLSLDEISAIGYEVKTVCIDKNSILNYEVNVVVIETSTDEAKYSIDEARSIVYDLLRAQYDDLLHQIDSGELLETHSEDRIINILNDSERFTVSAVSFHKNFGRYYVLTASVFGAPIYFDRYTGEIFSDKPVSEMATIYISRGMYSLSRAYW